MHSSAQTRRDFSSPDQQDADLRIAIEAIEPEIEEGRFYAKAIEGEPLLIAADLFADGIAALRAQILFRSDANQSWQNAPLRFWDNDRWQGAIPPVPAGWIDFTIEAWLDVFGTWRRDYQKKAAAGVPVDLDLQEGRKLIEAARPRAKSEDHAALDLALTNEAALLAEEVAAIMDRVQVRRHVTRHDKTLRIKVERRAARFSAWYELFPRSQSGDVTRHGTFDDVIARLPYVQGLGFDVLYLTPIHPIGRTNRKGRDNNPKAEPGEPGSPYAIGAAEGGHTAIHPELGTLDDFRRLVKSAHAHGLEIALDFAIQCAPDHPWLKEHPDWFAWRSDGSLRYAENPPKKYEDIVNVEFYGKAFPAIWLALRDVVLFWAQEGVRIFRVDNPHTKPFPFWEWLIGTVQARHPDVIFLAEAFTRPKVMKRLAKLGFTQSYTYFTWRETKRELTAYLTELARAPDKHFFRPNFFANTPDINPHHLADGDRPAFLIRATLAATLSSAYGIYSGFELCEAARLGDKEEYKNSEKYELRAWDWNRPGNIRVHIEALNRIRRENPALHDFSNLRFYNAFDDNILYYGKMTPKKDNILLIAVNLDAKAAHSCRIEIPLWEFGLPDEAGIEAENLLTGERFTLRGKNQDLHLSPNAPCVIWRLTPPAEARP